MAVDPTEAALGEIEVTSAPARLLAKRPPPLRLPIVRGVVALGESLKIGFKALGISANAQPRGTRTASSRVRHRAGGTIPAGGLGCSSSARRR